MKNMALFECNKAQLKINKPIRLIELFAGIGSQAKALKRLGADFEHYKISEWEINANASYKAIHKGNDTTDYSEALTPEELTNILYKTGISTDGKKPMSLQSIARKGEQWKRTVYNDFKATNNIGSILSVSGKELGIVETDKYCYIMTYSFPCQDLSLAGKGNGMAKGSGTRSGLLWEVERLLNECDELPQILLMENVTQVHGKKNKEHFDEWIAFLESKGYSNYWQDLNAKNFGIPQNRNRTFMVSVLGEYSYEFPQDFPLKLRLKDMLEDSVDEKFYLSDAMINYCIGVGQNGGKFPRKERFLQNLNRENTNISNAITTNEGNRPVSNFIVGDCEKLSNYIDDYTDDKKLLETLNGSARPQVIAGIGEKKSNGGTQWYQQNRVYDDEVAISVTTAFNPYYAIQKDDSIVGKDIVDPFICASRGRNPENPSDRTAGTATKQRLEPNFSGCSNTLTTVQKDNYVAEPVIIQKYGDRGTNQYSVRNYAHTIPANPMSDRVQMVVEQHANEQCNLRIRKLTPKECWRLMGFDDDDFEKASAVNSNTQLYKQAGNSIVVNVLYYIFKNMGGV